MKYCSKKIAEQIQETDEEFAQASSRIRTLIQMKEHIGQEAWLVVQLYKTLRNYDSYGYSKILVTRTVHVHVIPWTIGPFLLENTGGGFKYFVPSQQTDWDTPVWNVHNDLKSRIRLSKFNIPILDFERYSTNAVFLNKKAADSYQTWLILSANSTEEPDRWCQNYEKIISTNNDHIVNMGHRFLEKVNETSSSGRIQGKR